MNVCIRDQTECSVWDTPEGYLKVYTDDREIAEGSRALPALPETKHQQSKTPVPGDIVLFWPLWTLQTWGAQSHMQAKQQYT